MSSKGKYLSSILAPVSLGELIDKITILEIKQIHMTGIKLQNIDKELKLLKSLLELISFRSVDECCSTTSNELPSLESSYKANEYLCAEVFENPMFLLNLFF